MWPDYLKNLSPHRNWNWLAPEFEMILQLLRGAFLLQCVLAGLASGGNDPRGDTALLDRSCVSVWRSIAANGINVRTDARLSVRALGDGVADDTAAVRAAIEQAAATGGGVVYFPAGTYKIVTPSGNPRGSSLRVPSRVILRG